MAKGIVEIADQEEEIDQQVTDDADEEQGFIKRFDFRQDQSDDEQSGRRRRDQIPGGDEVCFPDGVNPDDRPPEAVLLLLQP